MFYKKKKVHQKQMYFQIAQKGSKVVNFCQKVRFLKQKIIEIYRLSGQNLSIMILENSSDYRDFDNDNLSIANTMGASWNFTTLYHYIIPKILPDWDPWRVL
jgi:hypothetical protein